MGLVEAILIGIQFKKLEKPIVFVAMLVCFIAFTGLGVVIVLAGVEAFNEGKGVASSVGLASLSLLFFGLSSVCGYFIKRCVKS